MIFKCLGCNRPLTYHEKFAEQPSDNDYQGYVCMHCGFLNIVADGQVRRPTNEELKEVSELAFQHFMKNHTS